MDKIKELVEAVKSKEMLDIIIAVSIFVVFFILSSIFAKIIMKCFKIKPDKLAKRSRLYKILKFIWDISGTYISLLTLNLPADFMQVITKIFKLILIYCTTRAVALCIQPDTKLFLKVKERRNTENEHTVKFLAKFIRGIIYIIGTFIFISELGYDLSGLITGLGISSVVLALAAQDLAKNLFGGFAIITDKTFVIGDTIEVKDVYGVVEDITFRTTKIRKLDNTVITMPNSILADSNIINWNKVKNRRYDCEFKLALETTKKEINDIMKKLLFELKKEKNIDSNSVRVYFSGLEEDGYKIKIYLYTKIKDYDEYIKFVSDTNSNIIALLETENIKLIYPTYDVHVKNK